MFEEEGKELEMEGEKKVRWWKLRKNITRTLRWERRT